VETGAKREAWEESRDQLQLDGLLAIYSVPRISQVQIFFRASLIGDVEPGPESEEVSLFAWDDIPWAEIAFPTVHEALHQWHSRAAPVIKTMASEALPPDHD